MENLYTPLSLLIDPFVINRTESVAPSSIAMITNREDFKRYLDWRGQRGEGEGRGGESRRATVKGEKTKLSGVIHSYRRRRNCALQRERGKEKERERDMKQTLGIERQEGNNRFRFVALCCKDSRGRGGVEGRMVKAD